MISAVINALAACLPLRVARASWEDPVFSIGGEDWSFNCLSAWRVRDARKVLFACSDEGASNGIVALIGQSVVRVFPQSMALVVDPAFEFSDGSVLEIFATDTLEPWTLRLPTGEVFVASPSDVTAMK